MYLFANRGLGMSPGKLAAQVAHAAVEAYRISGPLMVDAWYSGGHYTKLVMLAEDEIQLDNIQRYLEGRGFKTSMIIDEGRTEIKPFSKTALGVTIVDKLDEHVSDTFGSFQTYKETKLLREAIGSAYGIVDPKHLTRKGKQFRAAFIEH